MLVILVIVTMIIQYTLIAIKPIREIFGLELLTIEQYIIIFMVSLSVFIIDFFLKILLKNKK
ncbi:hypothetical protein D3C72_2457350 [compost metagenome]